MSSLSPIEALKQIAAFPESPDYSNAIKIANEMKAIANEALASYRGGEDVIFNELVRWATHEGWQFCSGRKDQCGNETIIMLSQFKNKVAELNQSVPPYKEEVDKEPEP